MAHYAANFTSTTQSKPSVLEILAQDSLSEVLYPAIRTLISVLDLMNYRYISS